MGKLGTKRLTCPQPHGRGRPGILVCNFENGNRFACRNAPLSPLWAFNHCWVSSHESNNLVLFSLRSQGHVHTPQCPRRMNMSKEPLLGHPHWDIILFPPTLGDWTPGSTKAAPFFCLLVFCFIRLSSLHPRILKLGLIRSKMAHGYFYLVDRSWLQEEGGV